MKLIMDQLLVIEPFFKLFSNKSIARTTATPERMDGENIRSFLYRIAAEIRLPEALNKNY
jgi:superfamily II DNA or RNA helicase